MADFKTSTPEERAAFEGDLAKITDFSGFHMDEIPQPKEESSSEAESEENTTLKEDESQPVQTQEDREPSKEKAEQEQSNEQSQDDESQTDTTQQETESNRIDPKPKQSAAQKRIHQLLETSKTQAQEIADLKSKLEKGSKDTPAEAVKSESKHIIPPPGEKRPEPYKSKWTTAELKKVVHGDYPDDAKAAAREELDLITESKSEQIEWDAWEIKNKQAYDRQASEEYHYTQEAVKLVPELNDATSEAYKQFAGILNQVKQVDPEFLKRPQARLLFAKATKDRMASLRLDSVLKENETLKKEMQRFKKSAQPLVASGAQTLGESTKESRPYSKGDLASRIKQMNPQQRAA